MNTNDDQADTIIHVLDEILGAIKALQSASSAQSSVELAQTARGTVSPTVKIYALNPEEASIRAQEIFDALREKYGTGIAP